VENEDMHDTPDAAFMYALEEELDRRGVRNLDNSIGWDVSGMPDGELTAMEDYLEGIWMDISKGMLKTIKEGQEKKRAVSEPKEGA
jgi:hypothetical protein